MRRATLTAPAALAVVLAAALAARAQDLPAAQHLPAGRTIAYVEVPSWKAAEAAFAQTDVGQAWQSLAAFRETLVSGLEAQLAEQKAEFERETGVAWDDVTALLQNGFAIAAVDTAPAGGQPQVMPVFVFPAPARPTVSAFLEKMKQQQGAQAPPVYLVDREGVAIVTTDQNALAPGDGSAQALASDPQFQAMRAKVVGQGPGGGLFFLHVNVAEALARFGPRDPETTAQLEKTGLKDVRGLGLGLGIEGTRLREAIAIHTPGERRGVARILLGGRPIELPKLAQTAPASCLSFGAQRLDLRALLDQTIELVKALDPSAEQELVQAIADLEQQLGGLRLREDILDPLGDVFTSEMSVPEDGLLPESVFSITVDDAAKVQRTLTELARQAGYEVKSIDRGGRRIHYLLARLGKLGDDPTQGMSEEQMTTQLVMTSLFGAWTIDGGRLWFSSMPQAIEDRFERLEKGSLAEVELFKRALAEAPPGTKAFSFGRNRPMWGVIYHVLLTAGRSLEAIARGAGIPIDTALLPRPSAFARGFTSSTSYLAVDADHVTLISKGGVPIFTTLIPIAVGAGLAIPRAVQPPGGGPQQIEWDLRMLASAEMQYKDLHGSYTGSINDLIQAGLIDQSILQRAAHQGISYVVQVTGPEQFSIIAHPRQPGRMALMIDESFEVRPYGMGRRDPASGDPPPRAPEPPGVPPPPEDQPDQDE